MHEYVLERWGRLDAMTGPNFLVMALENSNQYPEIENFAPDDVFEVGRYLGAEPRQIPCLVLFSDPRNRNDSVVLELNDFLPPASEVVNADFTDFFSTLSSLVDLSVPATKDRRLSRLQTAIDHEWPPTSRLSELVSQGSNLSTSAVARTATIASAAIPILTILGRVAGG